MTPDNPHADGDKALHTRELRAVVEHRPDGVTATLTANGRRTVPHTADPEHCGTQHCHIHQVDEPDPIEHRGGLACGECNHSYRTGRDLRRAYIRGALELCVSDLRHLTRWGSTRVMAENVDYPPPFHRDPFATLVTPLPVTFWMRHPRVAALRRLTRLPFTRARDITFCPHCIHDL